MSEFNPSLSRTIFACCDAEFTDYEGLERHRATHPNDGQTRLVGLRWWGNGDQWQVVSIADVVRPTCGVDASHVVRRCSTCDASVCDGCGGGEHECQPAFASDDATKPKPPAQPKPAIGKRPTPGDAMARAMKHALSTDLKILLVTAKPGGEVNGWDCVVMFEFGSKDLGLYYAHAEPDQDQWILVESEQVDALKDAIERIKRR